MKTRVVNRYSELYDIYIGRPSKWGNPFLPVGRSSSARLASIICYRDWIVKQSELMASLHELKGKRLGCYCAPKTCHGDVLVELVDKYVCDECGLVRDEYPFCSFCDGLEI